MLRHFRPNRHPKKSSASINLLRNLDQNFEMLPVNIPNTFICDKTIDVFLLISRSLRNYHEKLEILVDNLESPPAILGITESWLINPDPATCYRMQCYETVLSKTRQGKVGGIMLQFAKEIDRIEEFPCSVEENVSVEVRISGNTLLLLVLYNPPRSNKLHFLAQWDHELEQLSRRNKKVTVMGDLNIDILRDDQVTRSFVEIVNSNGFSV